MKVSMKWLNEWIEVMDLDSQELADRLTMAGLEVDGIEMIGFDQDLLVVGQIEAIEEHPKADRLVVCTVNVGDESLRTIVCGAKNMSAGDRVPVALPGANPPGIDFEIVKRKVMGVPSEGMLCSAEELALAEESEGLMILKEDLKLGTPIFEALNLKDVIIEIDLTPNRADCLSHYGIAREISALYGRPMKQNRASKRTEQKGASSVRIVDSHGCPEYRFALLSGVQVGPSPAWLQQRLTAVGQRCVNNVVDVTNFLLLDCGQPFHAFDGAKLAGKKVIVRRAKEGESLVAIDHGTYKLDVADLVIADEERPQAIAGVMGGAESEVSEETTEILLECAYFDPTTVRKSAKRHGIHSESSHRFERGIDPGALGDNILRAFDLLERTQKENFGTAPRIEQFGFEGRDGESPRKVDLSVEQTRRLLGIELTNEEIKGLLLSIGLELIEEGEQYQSYLVPTYRGDLERPVDLIEEVARLYGYENIPAKLPRLKVGSAHKRRGKFGEETILSTPTRQALSKVRGFLLDLGLFEVVNYSFMGEEDLDRLLFGKDDKRRNAPVVANPLVKDQAFMRTTLIPSLLDNVQTNFKQRRFDVPLFEIGRRYFLEEEQLTLGIALTGAKIRHFSETQNWDFFDLKGVVEAMGAFFSLTGATWSVPTNLESYLHPGVQALWSTEEGPLAVIGQLHPRIAQSEDFEGPLFLAEIALDRLLSAKRSQGKMVELPKYPSVVRDFALLMPKGQPFGELEDAVDALASQVNLFAELFRSFELFDVYEGPQVGEDQRSLAVKVIYGSDERTLTDKDVEEADKIFLGALAESVGARLR